MLLYNNINNGNNINENKITIVVMLPLFQVGMMKIIMILQANLDMTDSMGPGKLVRQMQNLSYTYDKYLICIGLGPSILSVICKTLSYSGPSYPSSPVYANDNNNNNKVIIMIGFVLCIVFRW